MDIQAKYIVLKSTHNDPLSRIIIMFIGCFRYLVGYEREWFPDTHFHSPYTHPHNNQYVTIIKHKSNPEQYNTT